MWWQLAIKALVSGALIAAASEFARRSPAIGGLLVSLPLASILTMLWLWRDTGDKAKIADLALSSTLYVNASLPGFILLIVLLRRGVAFPLALAGFVALSLGGYLLVQTIGRRFGLPV
jgi:F0F1-type ATP synthase assembly protein I